MQRNRWNRIQKQADWQQLVCALDRSLKNRFKSNKAPTMPVLTAGVTQEESKLQKAAHVAFLCLTRLKNVIHRQIKGFRNCV